MFRLFCEILGNRGFQLETIYLIAFCTCLTFAKRPTASSSSSSSSTSSSVPRRQLIKSEKREKLKQSDPKRSFAINPKNCFEHVSVQTKIDKYTFLNGPFPASFSLFLSFLNCNWQISTIEILYLTLGFEPRISGIGSDRSANCATTTALTSRPYCPLILKSTEIFLKDPWIRWILFSLAFLFLFLLYLRSCMCKIYYSVGKQVLSHLTLMVLKVLGVFRYPGSRLFLYELYYRCINMGYNRSKERNL